MTKQTIEQAIHLASTGKSRGLRSAANSLDGHVMGDAAARQAMSDVRLGLPVPSMRSYTLDQFVARAYTIDSSGRYRSAV